MSVYRDVYEALAAHQDGINPYRKLGPEVRLMKLSEEVGEVMQAYIGVVGANKRKGVYADGGHVAKELADVVITAMIAMHDWTDSPERFLKGHLQALMQRISEEGS